MAVPNRVPVLDWNDVRFFLAVARERSFARAAVTLGVDQTTVGRRIASLEEKLSVSLFTRGSRGLELTIAGERVVASAERMEESALELSAQAVDPEAICRGVVRIATTEGLAERFVIPALRNVQLQHPNIEAILVTGWTCADLRRGEADVAVRLIRPTDPRLAFRKLAEFSFCLYASREYIAGHGLPDSLEGHQILGYEEAVRATGHAFANVATDGGRLAFQTNCGRILVAAAVAGLGIAQLPSYVGDGVPGLVPVLQKLETPQKVWLVLPQAKRRVAAVRVVIEAIRASFERNVECVRPRYDPADLMVRAS